MADLQTRPEDLEVPVKRCYKWRFYCPVRSLYRGRDRFNTVRQLVARTMSETNRAFSDSDCPLAVLTANYGGQLAAAMDDPPVTWASDAGWVKAKQLVGKYGDLPLYIRGTEEESESHLVTHLGIVSEIAASEENPEHADELKQYLLSGDAMHEGEDEYSHYIRVDDCWALEDPFPQDDLVLDSKNRPVNRNYSRNYAIVQLRAEDV